MLVTSWPLPDGTRLFPRLLSNAVDAPYIGETGILFNLTRLPGEGVSVKTGGSLPKFVLIFLATQIVIGLILPPATILSLRRWQKRRRTLFVPLSHVQVGIWGSLLIASIICLCLGKPAIAMVLLLGAQFFPRCRPLKITP
jgi:hypothetical protein